MSDSGESEGSAPPAPQGDAVPADVHGAGQPQVQAEPQHPVWRAAAGKGARNATPAPTPGRFAPISMLALELRQRNELDGSSSVGSEKQSAPTKRSRKGGKEKVYEYDQAEECQDADDDEDDNVEGGDGDEDCESGVFAGAAFGVGFTGTRKRGRKSTAVNKTALSCSAVSDTDDGASMSSETARAAHRRAFPISGVSCVGCALPGKVVLVDEFVQKNCDKMQEAALFKMANLVYVTKVADPAEVEGLCVPPWGWMEIRAHYQLHKVDARFQRFENIRTLGAMRKTLEMQLMRTDESGELLLDKNNSEQIMKVITLSSRELSLLQETTTTGRPKK